MPTNKSQTPPKQQKSHIDIPTPATTDNHTQTPPRHPEPAPEPDTGITVDQVFESLKSERRRLVLHYLKHINDETTVSDLAEYIAAIENNKHPDQLGTQERKRVYIALQQCHLDTLAEADIIQYDKNRGTVTTGRNDDLIDSHLNLVTEHDSTTSTDNPAVFNTTTYTWLFLAFTCLAVIFTTQSLTITTAIILGIGIITTPYFLYRSPLHQL